MKFEKIAKLTVWVMCLSFTLSSCELYELVFPEEEVEYFVLKKASGTVSDIDGNSYKTIKLGSQWWMAENLKTTHYSDGSNIPYVKSSKTWQNLAYDSAAYCFYNNNDSLYKYMYGGLYTWAAAVRYDESFTTDDHVQGICPDGWHIPDTDEWDKLITAIKKDINSDATGTALKSTSGWSTRSAGFAGKDYYGFTGLPTGYRNKYGTYVELDVMACYWTVVSQNVTEALYLNLYDSHKEAGTYSQVKKSGLSVRCIKD